MYLMLIIYNTLCVKLHVIIICVYVVTLDLYAPTPWFIQPIKPHVGMIKYKGHYYYQF